jgi:hypothetical protein
MALISKIAWVTLTRQMIEEGYHRDCYRCPWALAVDRVLRPEFQVEIRQKTLQVKYSPSMRPVSNGSSQLPAFVQEFVFAFDHDMPVFPMSAMLELPAECLRDDAGLAGISVAEWHCRAETAQRVIYFLTEFDPRYGKSKTAV